MEESRRKEIGQRIRELRLEKHLTQAELAEILGKERTTITKLEAGENELTQSMRLAISGFFEVSQDWLLEGKGPKYVPVATLINQIEDKARGLGKDAHRLFLRMKNAYREQAQMAAETKREIELRAKVEILLAIGRLMNPVKGQKKNKEKETIQLIEDLLKKAKR